MKLSKYWVTGAVILFAAASLILASGEDAKPHPNHSDQLSVLMLAKLASSQKIVSGLVSEDFDQIRRGADELSRVAEATDWAGHNDPVFAHYRTELKRQAQKLIGLAEDGNLDGAAYTYMHSLTTCISCHEYSRDVLKIAADPQPSGKVIPIPVTDTSPLPENRTPRR